MQKGDTVYLTEAPEGGYRIASLPSMAASMVCATKAVQAFPAKLSIVARYVADGAGPFAHAALVGVEHAPHGR